MLEEERAAHLRMERMLYKEADSRRRLIDGMGELAAYYAEMNRELTQMRTFFAIPAPTATASTSQIPPPPPPPGASDTTPTLPDDPSPPPLAIVTTSDPAATESRIPLPPIPVLPTTEGSHRSRSPSLRTPSRSQQEKLPLCLMIRQLRPPIFRSE